MKYSAAAWKLKTSILVNLVHKKPILSIILSFGRNSCTKSPHNCHLFTNSDNSDYTFLHINYDPPEEYQILITLFTWLDAPYRGVILEK